MNKLIDMQGNEQRKGKDKTNYKISAERTTGIVMFKRYPAHTNGSLDSRSTHVQQHPA